MKKLLRTRAIEIAAGAWIAASVVIMYCAITFTSQPFYLTVMFALLALTIIATGYVALRATRKAAGSARRQHEVGVRLHEDTHRKLGVAAGTHESLARIADRLGQAEKAVTNSEAARARASVQLNRRVITALEEIIALAANLSSAKQAIADSEAARARGTVQLNRQLNAAVGQLDEIASVIERVRQLALSSHDQLVARVDHPVQLAEELTRHAVKMEMSLDLIHDALTGQPSHKEQVLARLAP